MKENVQVRIGERFFTLAPQSVSKYDKMLIDDQIDKFNQKEDESAGNRAFFLLMKLCVKAMKHKDGFDYFLRFDNVGLAEDSLGLIGDFDGRTKSKLLFVCYSLMDKPNATQFIGLDGKPVDDVEFIFPTTPYLN